MSSKFMPSMKSIGLPRIIPNKTYKFPKELSYQPSKREMFSEMKNKVTEFSSFHKRVLNSISIESIDEEKVQDKSFKSRKANFSVTIKPRRSFSKPKNLPKDENKLVLLNPSKKLTEVYQKLKGEMKTNFVFVDIKKLCLMKQETRKSKGKRVALLAELPKPIVKGNK